MVKELKHRCDASPMVKGWEKKPLAIQKRIIKRDKEDLMINISSVGGQGEKIHSTYLGGEEGDLGKKKSGGGGWRLQSRDGREKNVSVSKVLKKSKN